MRFKYWLEQDGLAGTSLMHGGASVTANADNNSNMPVRSKWATKDSPDDNSSGINPDLMFGFQTPTQKKRTSERLSKIIDKRKKMVPTQDDQLNITY